MRKRKKRLLHLEGVFDQHLACGDEVILRGRIVSVSVDREAIESNDPYEYLRTFVYLDDGMYGVIERARRLEGKE